MRRILVFAALAASAACYTYVPVAPATAPQGTPVRARLSTMSAFELSQITVNNIGYASSYNSGTWYGDLQAYAVDTSTGLQSGSAAWSAMARLDAQTTRKIVSYNGSVGLPFSSANFAGTPSTLTAGVISFLRGDRTGEGTTYRTRQHLLGDIVNAEPVIGIYSGTPIVYQAANDGMLQGIDRGTRDDLAELCGLGPPVIASGGVTTLDDVRNLVTMHRQCPNLAGAIVGRAIYEGTLDLTAALREAAAG